MDILLERMLSLIPKKDNGKYVHGAKKEFCEKIGAPTNIVSEWEAEKTKSYRNYVHAVAMAYNVSVEWLKGESDQKEKSPTPEGAELDEETIELREIWNSADQEEREALLAMAKMLKARRNK